MRLSDLLIFKTVVEEGGIVRAARKLHRVPSGVTTRIQQLETSAGAQLFIREKQRLHLTPSGELLLSYAERCASCCVSWCHGVRALHDREAVSPR